MPYTKLIRTREAKVNIRSDPSESVTTDAFAAGAAAVRYPGFEVLQNSVEFFSLSNTLVEMPRIFCEEERGTI